MVTLTRFKMEKELGFDIDRSKRQVIFVTTTDNPTHGVPVVVANTREGLEELGTYQTYVMLNDFDSNKYILIDSYGNRVEYDGKEDFLNGIKRLGNGSTDWLDILHFHSFIPSDHFFHIGGEFNQYGMNLEELLGELPETKVVFTSHGSPAIDKNQIRETLPGVEPDDMSDEELEDLIERERIKMASTLDDWVQTPGRYTLMAVKASKQMIDLADQTTFVSDFQRDAYMSGLFRGANPSREPVTVYNGSDLSKYVDSPRLEGLASQLRFDYGIDPDKKTILFVGRIEEDKGVLELAEAVKRLNEGAEPGQEVQVVYVGSKKEENVNKIADIFGQSRLFSDAVLANIFGVSTLPENVIVTGQINDREKLAAMYSLADVVAQPTHGDCFNLVGAEGLIFEKPLLISNCEGPKEVYVEPGIAFSHEPGNADDLFWQLSYMLNHPDDAKRVAKKGKAHVMANLDYRSMAQRYSRVYDGLLEEKEERQRAKPKLEGLLASFEAEPETPALRFRNSLSIDPRKRNVLMLGIGSENRHGISVVMDNLKQGMFTANTDYEVSYLVGNFTNSKLRLYTPDGQERQFENMSDLAVFLANYDSLDVFDVVHMHSWLFSDYYSTPKDMQVGKFLNMFRNAKVVYTDHSSPAEDRITIQEQQGFDFFPLSPISKAVYTEKFRISPDNPVTFEEGWVFTGLKCREQLMELSDQVVHVSNAQKEGTRIMLPDLTPRAEHRVIYNGIDMVRYAHDVEVEQKAQDLRAKHAGNGEKVLLYVGRVTEHKGAHDLATVAGLLYDRYGPGKVKIIYVGSDVIHQEFCSAETMVKILTRSGNKGHVDFLDVVHDRKELAALYRMADVVVQPTWADCYNMVIGEALAMGTPVIASKTSGPKEVYIDKGLAIGYEPRDVGDLKRTIEGFLADDSTAKAAAAKGMEYVRDNLSVDAMAQQYLAIYDRLIEGSSTAFTF